MRIQSKTASPTAAIAGSNVTFVIKPRNAGPADALNVVVSDPLPAGWTYRTASGPNWNCSVAANSVSCTRPVLPITATDDITILATAPSAVVVGPGGTTYTNTATIASATADPNGTNNSGSANVEVRPGGADLSISKTKTPNPVSVGGLMTSTITVFNNGPQDTAGPFQVVELLTNEEYVSSSGTNWTCNATGNVVVCSNANTFLAAQATLPVLTIVTRALAVGTATNAACTGASVPPGSGVPPRPPAAGDPNPSNDCVSVDSRVSATVPDLAITKATTTPTGGDKVVSASENSVTYVLVVTNRSTTASATGVRIVDEVPAFIPGRSTFTLPITAVVTGGSATFSCNPSTAVVQCLQNSGTLPPGGQVTVRITVNRAMEAGTFTNTATVSNTVEGDGNPSNNTASDTVTIAPIADVEMTSKTVTPNPVLSGAVATYVFSYRNNGPSPADGVLVTDAFTFSAGDPGLKVLSVVPTRGTCTIPPAGGVILAPGGATGFTCTIGAMAVGETQSVSIEVRPLNPANGLARALPNTASVTTITAENPNGTDNGNNSKSVTLTIDPPNVDLLVNKTDRFDPEPYLAGKTYLDYRLNVTNAGKSLATGVKVTETMVPPPGKTLRFVCDTTTFGADDPNGSAACNPTPLCSIRDVQSPGAFTCDVPAGSDGTARGELAASSIKSIFVRFEALSTPARHGRRVHQQRRRVGQ